VNTDAEDDTSINAGIDKLEAIDEIAIIAAPGRTSATVYKALEDQAARTGDRFAILDPPAKENVSDSLVEFLPEEPPDPATDKGKRRPPDSQYAAFYYPRVLVGPQIVNGKPLTKDPAPDSNSPSYVTPVGHIAGVYARVDNNRGVHKAPAAEGLAGVLGVEHLLTDSQQDAVNLEGINLLRVFAGNVVIWGARTLQSNTKPVDADYKYINVRRLVNYIEESLQDGLRWAVFEPNTLVLQKQITRSVRGFLDGVWRDGGLFGESADNAYYVRFPAPFNRDEDRAQGKLTMEVGLRVTYPAEFIIIRIGIITQDASTA
jgi:hypothetical protein